MQPAAAAVLGDVLVPRGDLAGRGACSGGMLLPQEQPMHGINPGVRQSAPEEALQQVDVSHAMHPAFFSLDDKHKCLPETQLPQPPPASRPAPTSMERPSTLFQSHSLGSSSRVF